MKVSFPDFTWGGTNPTGNATSSYVQVMKAYPLLYISWLRNTTPNVGTTDTNVITLKNIDGTTETITLLTSFDGGNSSNSIVLPWVGQTVSITKTASAFP